MAAANPIPAQADDHRQRAALEYRLLNATVLTIPHAGAGANQTRDYVQTNPLNQDLHCLWHVFARGYYGNSPASHRRYDYIRQRVATLWDRVVLFDYPDNPARQDRGGLYHLMLENSRRGGRDDIVTQLRTGNWGTLDIVQLLADAFDVEIFVHVPINLVATHHHGLPRVRNWQLAVRGDHHPPNRQIHIVNWMNAYHWTLLEPRRKVANSDVIDPSDPVLPDRQRTPLFAQRDNPVPPPMRRYPLGHAVYNQTVNNLLVAKDIPHIPDVDVIQPRGDNAGAGTADDHTGGDDAGDGTADDHTGGDDAGDGTADDHTEGDDAGGVTADDLTGGDDTGDGTADDHTNQTGGTNAGNGSADGNTNQSKGTNAGNGTADRPVVAVAEQLMSGRPEMRIMHGKTPGNPGLAFTQLHVVGGPLSLYRAFARVYYGHDPQDQVWHTVALRVLRLWNAVMSPSRRDSLARRSRRELYTAMRQQNRHLDYELAGARTASIDVVQLIADAYGVNIYVHSPVGVSAKADQTATAQSWLLRWRGEHHNIPGARPLSFHLVHYRATNDWTGLRRARMSTSNVNQDPLGYYTCHDAIVQPLPGHPPPQPLQRLQPGINRRDRELGVPDDYEIVQIPVRRRDSSNDSDEPKRSSTRWFVSGIVKRAKSIFSSRPRRGARQRVRTRPIAIAYDPTPRDGDLGPAATPNDTAVPGAQHDADLLSQLVRNRSGDDNAQANVPVTPLTGTGRRVQFALGWTPPAQGLNTRMSADSPISPTTIALRQREARRRAQAAADSLATATAAATKATNDLNNALIGQNGITPPTTPGTNLGAQGAQLVTPGTGADTTPQPGVLPTPPSTIGNVQQGTKRSGNGTGDQQTGKRARVEGTNPASAQNDGATQGPAEGTDNGIGTTRGRLGLLRDGGLPVFRPFPRVEGAGSASTQNDGATQGPAEGTDNGAGTTRGRVTPPRGRG